MAALGMSTLSEPYAVGKASSRRVIRRSTRSGLKDNVFKALVENPNLPSGEFSDMIRSLSKSTTNSYKSLYKNRRKLKVIIELSSFYVSCIPSLCSTVRQARGFYHHRS